MSSDILLPEFAPPDKRCMNCKFYFRHMKRYDVHQIIRHLESDGRTVSYSYGQKLCIKNNDFTYFNGYCVEWGD